MNPRVTEFLESMPCPKGFTRIMSFNPDTLEISQCVMAPNAIMTDAADCLARVAAGDMRFKVAYMYFEYENLADPGNSPVVPTFAINEGVEYFTGLSAHGSKDFLRVPILAQPGFSSTDPANDGNQVTFYAITSGETLGYNGKDFTTAANSAVYGGALVCAPGASATEDKIFARNYPAGAKVIKPVGEQISIQWSVEFQTPNP